MQARIPGHLYLLDNIDGGGMQELRFVRRRDIRGEPLPPDQRAAGVLTQEVLRALIDRTLYLNAEVPSDEDNRIVEHLREALRLYESRAARRHLERLTRPELHDPCQVCGHLLCGHDPGAFDDDGTV